MRRSVLPSGLREITNRSALHSLAEAERLGGRLREPGRQPARSKPDPAVVRIA